MQKETVLTVLSAQKARFAEQYGVTRIGVFGSVARGEATNASDIDIIVEMPPNLFSMVHIKEELETLFAVPVDLIRYQRYLDTLLKSRIDREAIYV